MTSSGMVAVVDASPASDRVEILERQARRVHHRVATARRPDSRDAAAMRSRIERHAAAGPGSRRGPGTSGGGGGGGVPSRFSSIHLPRSTGDVRCGYAVTVRMLPWPSSPRRLSSVDRDAPEVAALDVGNAVVPGQPFVEEGVVRRQQIQHAAVLAQDAVEQQLRLAPKRLTQALVEIGEQTRGRASTVGRLRRNSHCPAKLVTSACDRASAQHPPHLLLEDAGLPERAVRIGEVEQLVIRDAAPEKERQPRGQLEIADPSTLAAAAAPAGSRSMRNRNSGLTSMQLERRAGYRPRTRLRTPSLLDRTTAAAADPRRLTGRRYARRASVERIVRGARCLFRRRSLGRQTKMRRRLGVSPGPAALERARDRRLAEIGLVPAVGIVNRPQETAAAAVRRPPTTS